MQITVGFQHTHRKLHVVHFTTIQCKAKVRHVAMKGHVLYVRLSISPVNITIRTVNKTDLSCYNPTIVL
jgi:hypothetical protein